MTSSDKAFEEGNYEKALEIYKKEGNVFKHGMCLFKLNKFYEAKNLLIDAYRKEQNADIFFTLYLIDKNHQNYESALVYLNRTIELQGFNNIAVPQILIELEKSFINSFVGNKEEGFNSTLKLLYSNNVPQNIYNTVSQNLLRYLTPLKSKELTFNNIKQVTFYHPINPGFIKNGEGYIGNLRYVNYFHPPETDRYIPLGEEFVNTRNFLTELDKDFNVINSIEIEEKSSRPRNKTAVRGIEDPRFFKYKGENWITGTSCEELGHPNFKIILGKVNNDGTLTNVSVMKGDFLKTTEKNWSPFIMNDEIYFLYSTYPFTIIKPNLETGECVVHKQIEQPLNKTLRNSTPLYPYENGWVYLVHGVILTRSRNYYHQLIYLDKDFHMQYISIPFIFKHIGVEYCLSMEIDKDIVRFFVSIEDGDIFIYEVEVKNITLIKI